METHTVKRVTASGSRRLDSESDHSSHSARLGARLGQVPIEAIENLLDRLSEADPHRDRLLLLFAQDPRFSVRLQVAEQIARNAWGHGRSLHAALLRLAIDDIPLVRAAAAKALQQLLRRATASERVELIAEWSTSPRPRRREALARGLRGHLEAVGAPTALELLSNDEHADVRRAVAETAGLTPHPSPWLCLTVLCRLSLDSRPSVRSAAIQGLGRATVAGLVAESLSALARCARTLDDETARMALEEIRLAASTHPKDATNAVQELLEHADCLDPGEMVLLVEILRMGGKNDPLGAASLRRLARESVEWVRDLALGALSSLEPAAGRLALTG